MDFIFHHPGIRVRSSFFVFLLMTSSIASVAAETNAIGFLLNDKLAFLAFNQVGNTILSKNQNLDSQSSGKSMHVFFDGKDLGQLKLLGTSKKCFKKYTKAETKSSKNCVTTSNMNFDSEILPPVPPTGPCPGDIGAEIQCPSSELNSAEIVSIPELITVSLSAINAKSLERPFASKRVKFSWVFCQKLTPKIDHCLLVSKACPIQIDGILLILKRFQNQFKKKL
ncbi:MAG: hypothetical protein HUU56_02075 [Bdellovibrionaceae bacterium]|nr:hypothetical protein [Pseudobdellovibrionaceae bacterium]